MSQTQIARLNDFIDARPMQQGEHANQAFIGQWGENAGDRGTCLVASYLNGLVGTEMITTPAAQAAHDAISGSTAFRWEPLAGTNVLSPTTGWHQINRVFNSGILPVTVEFSSMVFPETTPAEDFAKVFARLFEKNLPLVLSAHDHLHQYALLPKQDGLFRVVDSRIPAKNLQVTTNTAVAKLMNNPASYIQLYRGLTRH